MARRVVYTCDWCLIEAEGTEEHHEDGPPKGWQNSPPLPKAKDQSRDYPSDCVCDACHEEVVRAMRKAYGETMAKRKNLPAVRAAEAEGGD